MSKELFVTSTPHETKLAVVEDDQLVEVFFERENEYTLAGSIYKGKVTRVLPGMQSAFVDIGLERDAFLYVTDFLEDVEGDDDSEAVSAAPKGEQSQNGEARQDGEGRRENGEGRQERGGRGGRGRRGRGRRFEQNRSAQASEAQHQREDTQETAGSDEEFIESAADDQTEQGEAQQAESASGEQQEQSTQQGQSGDRLPRRWRGRRGRRRGRSFLNESKFAQTPANGEATEAEGETSEAEESDHNISAVAQPEEHGGEQETGFSLEHDATGGADDDFEPESVEMLSAEDDTQPEDVTKQEEEKHPRHAERERRPELERRPERSEQRQPQRIVLPGESLAKYNPRPEAAAAEKKPEPDAPSRFQKVAPRPSTEVAITSPSISAGVLAGESIAKYRNRPQPEHHEEPKVVEAAKQAPQRKTESQESSAEAAREDGYDVHEHHVESEKHRHEPEHAQPAEHSGGEDARGEYKFSPGAGVIEEEEIAEEEHYGDAEAEQFDDSEFEELEEETLEEEKEDQEQKLIAASEGLAAALMESRNPTKPVSYQADDAEEEDEDEGEEQEQSANAQDGDSEEVEEPEEAFTLEGGYQGPELDDPESDPEDPNYVGRAEMRGPSHTASFQQKADRGYDRGGRRGGGYRRGGRPQRGGRPMRGGGPRRNIPRGPMPQINELLKEGQEILVQIAKEPMAKKGARITSHIALPGRFLVFMPTVNHTGVSRKIGSEEERHRLKRILISEKGTSHGGFIVRTAAAGASEEDLRADIRFLINLWGEIKQRAETSKAPALIYHDLNLVERILRDQVTTTFSQIWVDNEAEYERILRFASRFQPSLVRRVKLYSKEVPLFEEFSIQDEINKALKSKVWLKSGGYIVINQTEALVAIDINTGKYVGKTARLEDTIVKTNIDAIKEIVRQIRLRDLGGIIVIDFIDMDERKNRQRVMQALEEALRSDRSPSKVLQFNDFGLVAITRKRVKQSLERTLGTQCTYCTGTGMIKSVATVCNEIYVELRKMAKHFDNHQITLRVNPEVGKALKENGGKWLLEMEELTKKTILVKNDPAQHQEQFDVH